jgi:4-hydroxy-4-methyl-2-oxoglutarate aldolase
VDALAELGVATVHEAIGRAGYMGPGLRPIQDGSRVGGTAATSLAVRGVRGLVIEAGVRDVADLRAMGFPVWSAAVSAQGTVKETPGAVNVPVSVGGQIIRPGDAIIADDDGVVCVPRGDVGQALAAARARVGKEEQTRKAWPAASSVWTCTGCGTSSPRAACSTCRKEPVMGSADGVRCMLMRGAVLLR